MPTTLEKPPLIEDKVHAVVSGEWQAARTIFGLVDEGAFNTTRLALQRLTEAGKIERRYQPHPAGEIAEYRLLQKEAVTPG